MSSGIKFTMRVKIPRAGVQLDSIRASFGVTQPDDIGEGRIAMLWRRFTLCRIVKSISFDRAD